MSVQHAASLSRKVLSRLNRTPGFWLVHSAACQVAAYVAIGRVFDKTSKYNIDALLNTFESNQAIFSKVALGARKSAEHPSPPPWVSNYINQAYYPTRSDIRYLKKRVLTYRAIYDRAFKPARNKYIAHREKVGHSSASALFSRGKVRELWRLSTFLLSLHEALWQLLNNGRKPILRTVRYSVKAIYDSANQGSSPHEYIVGQTKQLVASLQSSA